MFNSKKNKSNVDWNYVYTVHDIVSGKHIGLFYSPSDEALIRTTLPTVLMDYPLRDIEILRCGRFETNSGFIESLNPKTISLNKYLFPHSRLSSIHDDLSLEELDISMKDFKAKKLAEIDKKNDESVSDSSEVVNE